MIPGPWGRQGRRALLAVLALGALAMMLATNKFLTERYTETTRNRAELRLALYQGNLLSEVRKTQIVPLLMSRDPELMAALETGDYARTTRRLIELSESLGVASLTLFDTDGRIVAATDRSRLGASLRKEPAFLSALRYGETVFAASDPAGPFPYAWSRRIDRGRDPLGVIVVGIDLRQFETRWAGIADAVFVTDSTGRIILSTEGLWRGRTEAEALAMLPAPSAIRRALRSYEWSPVPVEAYFDGDAVMRSSARIPFQGWRINSFTGYSSVRERVNVVLAAQVAGFLLLVAGILVVTQRGAAARVRLFQRESAELRELNHALSREIADRERAEENLSAAEATLQQSSKLAALGEMSAAVSHELNQPLAAMKTYLAGANLLLQRNRPEEAMSSFSRIDGLIERMGAITRQLKSYARKGGDAFAPLDLRDALSGALSIMEPALRQSNVEILKQGPDHAVTVLGDRLRVEQVIINLLRNAVDATRGEERPRIEIILAMTETEAMLAVRDNGTGIADIGNLFEPFYTTKRPGDGIGLGLAISSGIASDMGGRLTARNARGGGAVFEMRLPLHMDAVRATRNETAGPRVEAAE